MHNYERSREQVANRERKEHRSRPRSYSRTIIQSRTRAYSRSISVPEPQRRRIGCIISSLVFVLFMVTGITVTAILLRKPGQADIKPAPVNDDLPKPENEDHEHKSVDNPPKGGSPMRIVVDKLKELGLRVEEDIDLNDPKLTSNDYARITEISDTDSIKTSEIAAILDRFKDANPKLGPLEEADAIKKFKVNMKNYNHVYAHLNHLLERYGYFRVNYEMIEKHNKGISD